MVFKLFQGHRQGRLSPSQAISGLNKVAGLGDGAKTTQHFDFERHDSDFLKSGSVI